jgi:capsule polysaccharide export protein KpsE/RkpR
MDEIKKKERKFGDYVYILYKWKKFLFINLLIIVIVAGVISFLLPKQYRATTTIMIPPENQSELSGLSNLLSSKSSLISAGARAFGVSSTSEDVLLGIINGRSALVNVINKFHLMKYYAIADSNMDKAIKVFRGDITFAPNEYGMIDFSVINKDPNVSAKIANYMAHLVDSLNIKYNVEAARNNRIFIEKRYKKNVGDLRGAEDSLYAFQKKYGIVAVPEQLEVTVKAAAEVEADLNKKEIQAFFMKQQYGENSPEYQGDLAEINLLKQKVQEMKNSSTLSSTSNVLFPFKEMPDIAMQYLRTYQEVKIQQEIMEIIMPMYEQAKVEEQKSIPTIMIVDKAVPPQLKYSPKKSVIILGAFFLSLFIFIPFVFWGEKSVTRSEYENPLQIKEANFFRRIIRVYRIKQESK